MFTRIEKQLLVVLVLTKMSIQGAETQPSARIPDYGFPFPDAEHDVKGLAGSGYQQNFLHARSNAVDREYENAEDNYAESYGQYVDSAKYLKNKENDIPIDFEEDGMFQVGSRNQREVEDGTYYGQVSNYFSGVMNSLSNRVAIYSGSIPFYS